ncbi:unnamed protein product [Soboliphyme baturini]|uniref:Serine/threonine-protein kinase ULK3 n=1 Tax=Soboliphyme baturini TaxID=241478 RepID=A0A183IMU0_9BILA|nr:unnamed protein product [Soboliphyme baturini]
MESTLAKHGYTLKEFIGKGAFGSVYRAVPSSKTQITASSSTIEADSVAVKVLTAHKVCQTQENKDNLIFEIRILKKLSNPHIVQLNDFFWDSENIYLILEYCGGNDLSSFLKRHSALAERVTKKFLQQLAIALQYLRSHNISHLDLKPQNILLTSGCPPLLKLADFGVAQCLKSSDEKHGFRGSPLYMAPEILLSHKYDAKADLWSVGIILYECLFGQPPFPCDSLKSAIQKWRTSDAIVFPTSISVSNSATDLLTKLLQPDPNKRIEFEAFFAHPFVDVEHAPNDRSLRKGSVIMSEAMFVDKEGRVPEAVKLYCDGVEYLLAALDYMTDANEKKTLREQIKFYLNRAEELKRGLSATRDPDLPREQQSSDLSFIELAWSDTPQVHAACVVVSAGDDFVSDGKYEEALQKYNLAVDAMNRLLLVEPFGRRKALLTEFINQINVRVQNATMMRDVMNLNLSALMSRDSLNSNEAENSLILAGQNQCAIQ